MFPLEDVNGNIVGFSGRIYREDDQEAKYVNSAENAIFKKGQILYNIEQARDAIRSLDGVYVFEGFMDVIAAHRAGVENAIAIMGTALTDAQIQAIKRLTANVTVCFDGDSAGRTAAKKAIYLLTEAGLNCQAVLLPGKYDPDDYLKAYGASKLKEYLTDNRLNGIDYLYAVEKDELEPTDITSIERFKNNVFRHLAFFNSAVINELYLKKMAADLQVSIETLQNDFNAARRGRPSSSVSPINPFPSGERRRNSSSRIWKRP